MFFSDACAHLNNALPPASAGEMREHTKMSISALVPLLFSIYKRGDRLGARNGNTGNTAAVDLECGDPGTNNPLVTLLSGEFAGQ